MRKVLRIMLMVVVALVLLLAIDGVLHKFQSSPTVLKWHHRHMVTNHLTVVLTGAQSTGPLLASNLAQQALQYGDVAVADYDRHRLDGKKMALDIAHSIHGYREVTFVGLSMGGLLAHDVIELSKRLDSSDPTKSKLYRMILPDAPTGLVDLKDQAAKFVAPVPIGPMLSAAGTKVFWHFGFKPPKLDEIEAGDNPQVLKEHWELSGSYPLDGWRDEIAFIVGHEQPKSTVLAGVHGVFLQSSKDVTVLPSAYDNWAAKFSQPLKLQKVESTHIGLLEFPANWEAAFDWAFRELGVAKLFYY